MKTLFSWLNFCYFSLRTKKRMMFGEILRKGNDLELEFRVDIYQLMFYFVLIFLHFLKTSSSGCEIEEFETIREFNEKWLLVMSYCSEFMMTKNKELKRHVVSLVTFWEDVKYKKIINLFWTFLCFLQQIIISTLWCNISFSRLENECCARIFHPPYPSIY